MANLDFKIYQKLELEITPELSQPTMYLICFILGQLPERLP